jgi:DNA-binding transcriptional ArsR family regulator
VARRSLRCLPIESTPAQATAPAAGVAVVGRDRAAGSLADPTRRRILAALQEPGSASSVARSLGLARQLVNYHVRTLQRVGLVEEVGRRRRRGLEERLVRSTAAYYILSPDALGTLGQPGESIGDRFSATYQVAVAARTIRELAELAGRARAAGPRRPPPTHDTPGRFATPAAREAFGNDLVETIARLVAQYHDDGAPGGRWYRLFLGAHPEVPSAEPTKGRQS